MAGASADSLPALGLLSHFTTLSKSTFSTMTTPTAADRDERRQSHSFATLTFADCYPGRVLRDIFKESYYHAPASYEARQGPNK